MSDLSSVYIAALEASRVATREYNEVCDAYRARIVGDDEYFAASRRLNAAEQAFDEAYAVEQARAALARKGGES